MAVAAAASHEIGVALHVAHEDDLVTEQRVADGTRKLRLDAALVAQVARHRLLPLVTAAAARARVAVLAAGAAAAGAAAARTAGTVGRRHRIAAAAAGPARTASGRTAGGRVVGVVGRVGGVVGAMVTIGSVMDFMGPLAGFCNKRERQTRPPPPARVFRLLLQFCSDPILICVFVRVCV